MSEASDIPDLDFSCLGLCKVELYTACLFDSNVSTPRFIRSYIESLLKAKGRISDLHPVAHHDKEFWRPSSEYAKLYVFSSLLYIQTTKPFNKLDRIYCAINDKKSLKNDFFNKYIFYEIFFQADNIDSDGFYIQMSTAQFGIWVSFSVWVALFVFSMVKLCRSDSSNQPFISDCNLNAFSGDPKSDL